MICYLINEILLTLEFLLIAEFFRGNCVFFRLYITCPLSTMWFHILKGRRLRVGRLNLLGDQNPGLLYELGTTQLMVLWLLVVILLMTCSSQRPCFLSVRSLSLKFFYFFFRTFYFVQKHLKTLRVQLNKPNLTMLHWPESDSKNKSRTQSK